MDISIPTQINNQKSERIQHSLFPKSIISISLICYQYNYSYLESSFFVFRIQVYIHNILYTLRTDLYVNAHAASAFVRFALPKNMSTQILLVCCWRSRCISIVQQKTHIRMYYIHVNKMCTTLRMWLLPYMRMQLISNDYDEQPIYE